MIRFLAVLTLLATAAFGQAFDKASPDKKAEEAFKNIIAMKGEPSTVIEGAMTFFNSSLGVQCEFCHDLKAFDSDAKNSKKTARNMITMTQNINKDSFRGQQRVTCYSCHQGGERPVNAPTIPLPVRAAGI